MQSQPLVTVKQASMLLGVERGLLREKLKEGAIKGERRRVGNKDRWFVHSGELDFLMNTERLAEVLGHQNRTTLEGLTEFFEKTPEQAEHPVETAAQRQSEKSRPGVGEEQRGHLTKKQGTLSQEQLEQQTKKRPGLSDEQLEHITRKQRTRLTDEQRSRLSENLREQGTQNPQERNLEALLERQTKARKRENTNARGQTVKMLDSEVEVFAEPIEAPDHDGLPPNAVAVQGDQLPAAYQHVPSLDDFVHSLTVEFAYRLAEERQLIYKLECKLDEHISRSEKVEPLERALQLEVRNGCMKDIQIKNLQAEVALLAQHVQAKAPLWQRFVSWLNGEKGK
jgi:hypothetical protein